MHSLAMPSFLHTPLSTTLVTALLGLPLAAASQALPDAGRALESLEQRRPAPVGPRAMNRDPTHPTKLVPEADQLASPRHLAKSLNWVTRTGG